ncbi:hypothetical protein [Streptomyces sp. NPDC002133]|uniref:hypothetical protein n=1 Tax=Streptomyces sp. NPDC002133 TaxID=3154409 RepID=UPI0033293673
MRHRSRGRVTLAGVAAMCAVAALPGGTAWAAGEPHPYAFDTDAQTIEGADSTANAKALTNGTTYRSSIGPDGKLNYRVNLDAEKNAYVSVVAVPRLGTKFAYGDGIKVSLQDSQGSNCNNNDAVAGSAAFARPFAAYAYRTIEKDSSTCQEAGAYNVLVERIGSVTSTPEDWELEIRHVTEPALRAGGPTGAPSAWPSASPGLPGGGSEERAGGTSFNDAAEISEGEWTSRMKAGRTYFYRVPVDWGQQIFATAAIGSGSGDDYVGNALTMQLYNPVRGFVAAGSTAYDGRQKQAALDPLPQVAYENRYDSSAKVNGMRFAGSYYLAVSLNPELGEKYGEDSLGVTLRVNIEGDAKAAPAYAGPLGDFGVSEGEKAEKSSTMKLVGAAGIGAGTVLVLGLGAWTLLARRRTAGAPQVPADGIAHPQSQSRYGPPATW